MANCYITGLRAACLTLRSRLGISQQELSSRLGIAHTTLVRWESRGRNTVRTYSVYLDAFRDMYTRELGNAPELGIKTAFDVGRNSFRKPKRKSTKK